MQNNSIGLKLVQLFHLNNNVTGKEELIMGDDGQVVYDANMVVNVAKFLCDYAFNIMSIRESIKTIAQKHAMRGSGALIAHIVNDYLIKELPIVRDRFYESSIKGINIGKLEKIRLGWEIDPSFRNYANVQVIEYEDDNEYFNIDPSMDVRFT